MSIKLVIFDLGGPLVKVNRQPFFRQLAHDTKTSVTQLETMLNDPQLIEPFELGHIGPKQFFDDLNAKLGLSWAFERFVTAWNEMLSENTETTWVLERLQTHYTVMVLSNIDVLHDEHVRQSWPVFAHVHHWITSYQVGLRKPEPELYQLALDTAQTPPEAALFVDDIEEHILAARRLGLHGLHFQDGMRLEEDLRAAGLHF